MILLILPVREYSTLCISAGPAAASAALGLRNISELELSQSGGGPLVEEDPAASCCDAGVLSSSLLSTRSPMDGLR